MPDDLFACGGAAPDGPISVYVHIPFCETKCPYCDFNTYAGMERLIPAYIAALCTEIEIWGGLLGRPSASTVFFGGGTPSYLPEAEIGSVVTAIRSAFDVDSGAEITLEANPGDLSLAKLDSLRGLGINRLSIGVQGFDDRLLKLLGRRHSADEAVRGYRMAREAGFANLSLDLMYGLPHQTLENWRRTVDTSIELDAPHLSMYCLTLEGGTPMEREVADGTIPEPDPDLAADMYRHAEMALEPAGYRHYEISNWASPGMESRHNLTFWRNGPYLGVGPGAHSYLGGYRFANLKSPREYVRKLSAIDRPEGPFDAMAKEALRTVPSVDTVEQIDRSLEMAETLMLGLRLDDGVAAADFHARFGTTPDEVYGQILSDLTAQDLLASSNGRTRLTERGRFLSNEVFARLFE